MQVGSVVRCTTCGASFESARGQKVCSPRCRDERKRKYQSEWIKKNPNYHREWKRRPENMEKARAYSRQYRVDNLDAVRARYERWSRENPDYNWAKNNRDRAREIVRRRRSRLKGGAVILNNR